MNKQLAASSISPIAMKLAPFDFPAVRFEIYKTEPKEESSDEWREALCIEVQLMTFSDAWDNRSITMESIPEKYRNIMLPYDEMGNFRANPEDEDDQDPCWDIRIDWDSFEHPIDSGDLGYMTDLDICMEDLLRTELKGLENGGRFYFHKIESYVHDNYEGEYPPLPCYQLTLLWKN